MINEHLITTKGGKKTKSKRKKEEMMHYSMHPYVYSQTA